MAGNAEQIYGADQGGVDDCLIFCYFIVIFYRDKRFKVEKNRYFLGFF